MADALKSNLSKIKEYWDSLESKRKNSLVLIGLIFLIGLVFLVVLVTRPTYTTLYTNLDVYEAGEIYSKLTEMGADIKLKNDTTLLINEKQADSYRMLMAKEGYPKSGFNYDLYTDNIGMGVSENEKQTFYIFQVQERLQNTIKTLKGVKNAIVTISKPEETIFVLASQQKPITAAIVIDLETSSLSAANVKAIEHLVEKSMSGLLKENITIIDSQMNILNRRTDTNIGVASEKYELQRGLEMEIEEKILSMIEPIYGIGNVKTAANVKVNFDSISEERVEFNPVNDDQGIPYSVTERSESIKEASPATLDENNNLFLENDAASQERSVLYYVNQSTKVLAYEQGIVEDIKLSIIINSVAIADEVLENIRVMAANAIGSKESNVVVQALEFTEKMNMESNLKDAEKTQPKMSLIYDKDFVLKVATLFSVFLLGLLAILVFRKSILTLKPKFEKKPEIIDTAFLEELGSKKDPEEQYRDEIDKYVEKNPQGVADILKKWMHEE